MTIIGLLAIVSWYKSTNESRCYVKKKEKNEKRKRSFYNDPAERLWPQGGSQGESGSRVEEEEEGGIESDES